MDVNQQPKRQNARQRSNPLLVIFLCVFVFLPLMFLGGLYLAGLLTGNWQAWNWLMGLVGG